MPAPSYINEVVTIDTTKIRFDGFYSGIDTTDHYYTSIQQTIFNKEGRVFISGFNTINECVYTCDYYKFIKNKDEKMGYFTFKNNEIHAYLPVNIFTSGMAFKKYYSYFKGSIKNKDTITDWKMVKPYPTIVDDWVLELPNNQSLFKPKTMHFIKTEAVKCLEIE